MKGSVIRYSRFLIRTRREEPADAEIPSHKLLLKGGFIRQVASGVFDFTPIAFRVMKKIMDIIRHEMNRIDGQELLMPVLNPASLWTETGRFNEIGPELIRFKDRRGTNMCLAMTNEETVTDLARGYISSYKDLPFMLYHIQTKIRDEARPRGGLVRIREFLMKDAYSFHRDVKGLARYYEDIYNAYIRTFDRMALASIPVEADSGAMGGSASHEFILPTDSGEDTFARCDTCEMAANIERAEVVSNKVEPKGGYPDAEEVHTPNVMTIDDLTEFFKIERHQFLKAVAYSADGAIVIAFINGAYEVNETKLRNYLGAIGLEVADPSALSDKGIVPGYISPSVAKIPDVKVVFDRTVMSQSVYVVGGDKEDYHIKGAVVGRDFEIGDVHDMATVREDDPCPKCSKGKIKLKRGIELGHTFQLGTKYSESMGLKYLNEEGKEELVVMGCYGIGIERAMASIVEAHHDDKGMIWPVSVAPFDVMVLPLGSDDEILTRALEVSETIGSEFDVLIDDRMESAGVKFNDSDLVGIPLRVVVSKKLMAKGDIEFKVRRTGEVVVVSEDKAKDTAISLLENLRSKEAEAFNSNAAIA